MASVRRVEHMLCQASSSPPAAFSVRRRSRESLKTNDKDHGTQGSVAELPRCEARSCSDFSGLRSNQQPLDTSPYSPVVEGYYDHL